MKKINANRMNHMEIDSTKHMMEISNLLQKIGKSRRKYSIKMGKTDKGVLVQLCQEIYNLSNLKNILNFILHIKESIKDRTLMLSYEELQFLQKVLSLSLLEAQKVTYPKYRLIKRFFHTMTVNKYKSLLGKLKI